MATFNYAELLEIVADTVPDRVAVVCGDDRLTYRELHRRVDLFSRVLEAHGLRRGDTMALHLYNSPEYLVAFFAACRLGVLPFNVNYRYVGPEIDYLYGNARAAAAVVSAEFVSRLTGLARPLTLAIVVGGADSVMPAQARAAMVLDDALHRAASWSSPSVAALSSDQLIIYTGGTTGLPKGVVWNQEDMLYAALGGAGFFSRVGPIRAPEELRDRVLESPSLVTFPVPPLMHGAALWATLASVFAGHTIVLDSGRQYEAERVLDIVAREGVNVLTIVGDGMAQPLVAALESYAGHWDLARLMHIGSGGAVFSLVVQQALKRQLPHVTTQSSLGSTESGTLGPTSVPVSEGLMRYASRADLAVICDGARFASVGETGVLARTGRLPVGYFGDPEKTAQTFVTVEGRRFSLTGDFARLEADGSIVVLGRGSTCINTGGEKVYPEEVEQALKACAGVEDALVVGVQDPRWGERVVAVVAPRGNSALTAEDLRAQCRQSLAGYKVPREVVFVSAVQRTNTGKPDYTWAREACVRRD